jgi:prepilin-type N-terminal cleavage/methylation domain-containing protein
MNVRRGKTAGFSLVEVIAVLVLVGILTALAGIGILPIAQGLATAKINAESASKTQLALTRLTREFTVVTAVSAGTASALTFRSPDSSDVAGRGDPTGQRGEHATGLPAFRLRRRRNLGDNLGREFQRLCPFGAPQ